MIGLELLLRLQELAKALAQKANLWMYFDHENEGPPLFSDRTRRTFCPQCEQRLKVQKTRIRNGRFLNIGAIQVKTTYMVCSHCKPQVVVPPELVTSLLPKFATLGLEVTVWIGLERFHKRRRIVDIQYELEGRGISVCENTVLNHTLRFLAYYVRVHYESAPLLKQSFEQNGGYILQFDSTSEKGSQKFLLFIEGGTGIVLDAVHAPRADFEHYRSVMEQIQTLYGDPLQLVSDLGKAEAKVANYVFPGILHRLCHFHYLRAVGEALLRALYDRFRDRLKPKKQKLKALMRTLVQLIEAETENFRDDLKFPALWEVSLLLGQVLRYKSEGTGQGFPFDLSAVSFYERCCSVAKNVDTSVRLNADLLRINRLLFRLQTLLNSIVEDPDLARLHRRLTDRNRPFLALRALFHLEPERVPLSDKHPLRWSDFQSQKMAAMRLIKRFRRAGTSADTDEGYAREVIIGYLRKYWSGLFCIGELVCGSAPSGSSSGLILLPRTNNPVEYRYRQIKHRIRHISGKKEIGRELDSLGKGLALVSNLDLEGYVEPVYGDLSTSAIASRFAQVPYAVVLDMERRLRSERLGVGQYLPAALDYDHEIAAIHERKVAALHAMKQEKSDGCSYQGRTFGTIEA